MASWLVSCKATMAPLHPTPFLGLDSARTGLKRWGGGRDLLFYLAPQLTDHALQARYTRTGIPTGIKLENRPNDVSFLSFSVTAFYRIGLTAP